MLTVWLQKEMFKLCWYYFCLIHLQCKHVVNLDTLWDVVSLCKLLILPNVMGVLCIKEICTLCTVYILYSATIVRWWYGILNSAYVYIFQGEASGYSNWDQKHWRHLQLWRVPWFRHSSTFRYTFSQLIPNKNSLTILIGCCISIWCNILTSFSLSKATVVSNHTEADLKSKDWVFINYTYKRFEGLTARGGIPSYMKTGKR